jgi:hypothetical protein
VTAVTPVPEVRAAIDDLYNTYLWALDTQDIDLYVGTFWPDAVFIETQLDGSVERWTDADSIREFTASHFGGYGGHQHRESNRLYSRGDAGGRERWHIRAYWFTSHRDAAAGSVEFTSTGHSRDIVELRDGEWRFAERWVERWPGVLTHPLREAGRA